MVDQIRLNSERFNPQQELTILYQLVSLAGQNKLVVNPSNLNEVAYSHLCDCYSIDGDVSLESLFHGSNLEQINQNIGVAINNPGQRVELTCATLVGSGQATAVVKMVYEESTGTCQISWETLQNEEVLNAELALVRELHRRIFENELVGMLITDMSDMNYVAVNRTLAASLGYSVEEFKSIPMTGHLTEAGLHTVMSRLQQAGTSGTESLPTMFDLEVKHRDGSVRVMQVVRQVIEIDSTQFTQSILLDVTELRKAEQLALENAKHQAVIVEIIHTIRAITHDLRNPLSSMGLNAKILESKIGEEGKRNIDAIQLQIEVMTAILEALRELVTASDTGKYRFEYLKIARIVRDIELSFREIVESEGKTLEVPEFDGDLDLEMLLSRQEIHRAISNLVQNANKYNPEGTTISLAAKQVGNEVIITVTDDGVGIPEEHLDKIFKPLYRVDSDSDVQGSGVGLSVVQFVVEKHKGTVTVKSEVGAGTTFTMRLPISLTSEG